jgi:hypothetical protein
MDNESIGEMLEDFDKDSKALKKSLFKLCWHMRGGMTLDETYQLSFNDREIVTELIKDHLEITKETGQPFF